MIPESRKFQSTPIVKCHVEAMTAIAVGSATKAGSEGVDLYVAIHGRLPDSYLTQDEAKERGWKKWLGNSRRCVTRNTNRRRYL